jgi:hypothetical protein
VRVSKLLVLILGLSCGGRDKPVAESASVDSEETGAPAGDSTLPDTASPDTAGSDPGKPVDTARPVDSGSEPDTAAEPDRDGDGYTVSMGDCDDDDPRAHPGGREICNLSDDDCDGEVDEEAWDAGTFFADADSDGFGDGAAAIRACTAPEGHVEDSTDCLDTDPSTHPGADEICDDVDNDCDGAVDDSALDPSAWYVDLDGDRYGDPSSLVYGCDEIPGMISDGTDCNDSDETVHPAAVEFCDGLDNDCDGVVDFDADFGLRTWYEDGDGDGHGDATKSISSCEPPSGYVWSSDDCDDSEATRYPLAPELCDLMDNDCDDVVDEEDVCLSCDVDYPTPLTVMDAGSAGGEVDAGTAECFLSGYDYSCDECTTVTESIGLDGEVTGAYRSLSWRVTSGSATLGDSSALSTSMSMSGLDPGEPDECVEGTYGVELSVEACDGTIYTDTVSFTLSCCGTG